jgi:FtsZ-binding cell division protein ZapB
MKKKTLEQMTLSGTEEEILARLSERVEKAISMIQELRRERDALKKQLESMGDLERFQKERNEIRNRIESILSNLESLDV